MSGEGGLKAPNRHPLDWQSPGFWDQGALQAEMERVFDICHGCRRCFNLCNAFPTLFDAIDTTDTGELEAVGDPATGLPIGPTDKNLAAAVAGETHEYTDMYPGMAKAAREEGFGEIADWFETLAKAERSHANRYQKALNEMA